MAAEAVAEMRELGALGDELAREGRRRLPRREALVRRAARKAGDDRTRNEERGRAERR
jgi:hypothetical protein